MSDKCACKCEQDKACTCKTNGAAVTAVKTEEFEYYQWSVLNFEAFARGMVQHAEKTNTLLKPRRRQ